MVAHSEDLLALSDREGRSMSINEIKKLNDNMYNSLLDYRPPENSSRARSITMNEAQMVLDAIRTVRVDGKDSPTIQDASAGHRVDQSYWRIGQFLGQSGVAKFDLQ